ncbi:carbon storage regulator CsrA [Paenisporosarcina quisquiliarum]|uniref:carbon storage regulator CsrA n=1 Tax=Paenisporosarcina quisquiliarum TaxID=365346 RepID=UPI003735F8B6
MLILTRKIGESIWINDEIEIIISEVKGDQVKIGINAPRTIEILRGELRTEVSDANTEALSSELPNIKKF